MLSPSFEARFTSFVTRLGWLQKLMIRLHVWVYRMTGGSLGGSYRGVAVLLLTHRGRKSGRLHTTPLFYLPHGDGYAVVASYAGNPQDPAWWKNLKSSPGEVEVGRLKVPVRAEEATPDAYAELWKRFVALYPAYDEYRRSTTRRIPIVLLRPAGAAAAP
ncbi:MAG: nitroreductase family deazaflavin-dependent oxidoreductase [Armatimonadetes bacterium]|nr:nitroreductase family deazaflavin-dependent oxidoreductase [Armatimonadota bacterium]